MHALKVVGFQQMIAAVFKLVDSIEFKIAKCAHPREQGVSDGEILSHCTHS
jgi:hypothetical protein